jgi:hypothetical protein
MDNRFEVTVGAGIMMLGSGAAARFSYRWTPRSSRRFSLLNGRSRWRRMAADRTLRDGRGWGRPLG